MSPVLSAKNNNKIKSDLQHRISIYQQLYQGKHLFSSEQENFNTILGKKEKLGMQITMSLFQCMNTDITIYLVLLRTENL